MYLLSSVECLCLVCRKDEVWFLYLVLNSFSVSPTYDSVVLLSWRVTVAWYITDFCRQFPLSGHVSFRRQLHVLLSLVVLVVLLLLLLMLLIWLLLLLLLLLAVMLLSCCCESMIRLLWMLMICFVLFMQL